MNIATLTTRVGDLSRAIEQSAANHNYLLGSLAEANVMLAKLQSDAEEAATVATDIAQVITEVEVV